MHPYLVTRLELPDAEMPDAAFSRLSMADAEMADADDAGSNNHPARPADMRHAQGQRFAQGQRCGCQPQTQVAGQDTRQF
jgi:hypothetical protein